MRGKIDPPDAGDLHVAPLRRALVDTAALDLVGRAAAHASMAGRDRSQLGIASSGPLPPSGVEIIASAAHIPVSAFTLPARSLMAAQPAGEDFWAHPTGDLAALVADVQAQLTRVRADG